MPKNRGIVFCPEMSKSGGDTYIPYVQIRPEQLRFFCLYWDYIVHPVAPNIAKWKRSKDEMILEGANILIKHHVPPPPNAASLYVDDNSYSLKVEKSESWYNLFIESQVKALKHAREKYTDTIWTPQQPFRNLEFTSNDATTVDAVQLELHKQLPTPTSNISIKKLVAFKADNQALFTEFKFSLEKLTAFVASSTASSEFTLDMALTDIDKLLTEIKKSSRAKWGSNLSFETYKVEANSPSLNSVISSFFKGSIVTQALTNHPILSLLGGTASTIPQFLKFNPVKSKRLHCIPEDQLELGYLTDALKKGIISPS